MNHKTRAYCSLAFLAWNSSRSSSSAFLLSSLSSHSALALRSASTTTSVNYSSSPSSRRRLSTSTSLAAPSSFSILPQTRHSHSSNCSSRSMSTTKGADAGDAGADADVETIDIAGNLSDVQARITTACAAAGRDPASVRLVAVSKTKPVPLLEQCVAAGITVLGENYVQELVEKVAVLSSTHDTIVWHFIGALQSNKANMLVGAFKDSTVDRLVVETVSSLKLAKKLNNAVPDSDVTLLRIFVQVNTSGEDSKSGVEPGADCVELCRQIAADCPKLHLQGLMTIGAPGDESCFTTLAACRDAVADALEGRDRDSLELSMGMSGDFEQAIMAGATNIRVGSTIFGARDYSTSTTK